MNKTTHHVKYTPGKLLTSTSCGWPYAVDKKVSVNQGAGYTTVRTDEKDVVDFEIEIDPEKLIRAIGLRAVRSKRGVSKLQGGAVVVRVVKKTRRKIGEKS